MTRLVRAVAVVAAIASSMPAAPVWAAAPRAPRCSVALAGQMSAKADGFAAHPAQATDAENAYRIAENEYTFCLAGSHPSVQSWQLRVLLLGAIRKRLNFESHAALAVTARERRSDRLELLSATRGLLADPHAPKHVKLTSVTQYVAVCSSGVSAGRPDPASAACRRSVLDVPFKRRIVVAAPTTPPCATPESDVRVVTQVNPLYPEDAASSHAAGTSEILVNLRADGSVESVSVAKSAGNPLLDDAAMGAARKTVYAPRISDCAAVAGTYTYTADFANEP